jgi:hypothetical protein
LGQHIASKLVSLDKRQKSSGFILEPDPI